MFDFLKKFKFPKIKKTGLEEAQKLGLITEEELLRLKAERADGDLKKYLLKGTKKRKK